MKLNYDLVRNMLGALYEFDGSYEIGNSDFYSLFPNIETKLLDYHITLLLQAGFISVREVAHKRHDDHYDNIRLTWSGQNFYAKIKDDGLWEKVKTHISTHSIAYTYEAILAAISLLGNN